MLAALIRQTRQVCEEGLSRPDLAQASSILEQAGLKAADCLRVAGAVTQSAPSPPELRGLAGRVSASAGTSSLERCLLLRAAVDALLALPAMPVSGPVKALLCEEFQSWARLDDNVMPEFALGRSRFVDSCKMASFRRFPAGQFDWELSGLPLSYLMRVSPRSLPRALYVTAAKLKGRAPVFFGHLGYRRPSTSLSEVEANRSYFRMAQSLELQPAVKGFVASSWIRSPDTHKVSPHLAWLNEVFLENGGFIAVMGRADPNGGVFVRSETRRRLYERGEFTPTIGLVIWPRQAMVAWAASHPEYGR
jgi:hypothetical protein